MIVKCRIVLPDKLTHSICIFRLRCKLLPDYAVDYATHIIRKIFLEPSIRAENEFVFSIFCDHIGKHFAAICTMMSAR